MLSAPQLSMQGNPVPVKDGFERIIEAFENVSYMGVLRQRWVEIKKLLKGGLQDSVPAAMRAK
jgi:hypothetical protein